MPLSFLCLVSFTFLAVSFLASLIEKRCRYLKDVHHIVLLFSSRSKNLPGYRPFLFVIKNNLGGTKIKNGHILPTGRWYPPSRVINDSLIMHYLALPCTIWNYLKLSCTILHNLALSCTNLHYLALSWTILHYLALSCSDVLLYPQDIHVASRWV